MTLADQCIYAAAWLAFGLLHSLTAGATARTGLGCLFGRGHRIAYNLIALIAFGGVLAIGVAVGGDAPHYPRPRLLVIVQVLMLVAGALLGILALRSYRAGPFVGWAQLSGVEEDTSQPLVVSGLNARMRHPLYTAILLIVWGAVGNDLSLATAIWVSLYLLIGSMFEERRLIARYGDAYRQYRAVTPRFIPLPRRV